MVTLGWGVGWVYSSQFIIKQHLFVDVTFHFFTIEQMLRITKHATGNAMHARQILYLTTFLTTQLNLLFTTHSN